MVDQEMTLLNNVIITFVAILALYEIVLYLTGNRSFISTVWENLKRFSASSLTNSSNKVFTKLMPVLSANVNKLSNYLNENSKAGTGIFGKYPRDQLNDAARLHVDREQFRTYDNHAEYNFDPIYHSGWENFVRPQPKIHTEYDPVDISYQQQKMEPWNYMSNSSRESLVQKTGKMLPKPTRLDSIYNHPLPSNETMGIEKTYENMLVQNYNGNGTGYDGQPNEFHDETHYQRHQCAESTFKGPNGVNLLNPEHYENKVSPGYVSTMSNDSASNVSTGGTVGTLQDFNALPTLSQLTGTNMKYSGDVRMNQWNNVSWDKPDTSIKYLTRSNNSDNSDSSDYPIHLASRAGEYSQVSNQNGYNSVENQYVSETMGAQNMPRNTYTNFF